MFFSFWLLYSKRGEFYYIALSEHCRNFLFSFSIIFKLKIIENEEKNVENINDKDNATIRNNKIVVKSPPVQSMSTQISCLV